MFYKVGFVIAALGGLTACTQKYESAPVEITTPDGPVTCQLYRPDMVIWDRPLSYPEGMETSEAASVCRKEGMSRKPGA
ncbi:hypothetical protein PANO111632_08430 [Paracoccus nototheniae]|uniref:Lipoprotein n=1 Tax=Paracoccus nototheniae TaxID=2489002 RepID=A0ABW4DUV9_9RHOB|nr:hypothetical protein [Paracoccus nototheniae]